MRSLLPTVALCALLAGCTAMSHQLDREATLVDSPTADWRAAATPADRVRLRNWRSSFVAALNVARTAGEGARIDAEGALLRPDAALPGSALPLGDYACRTIKIGAKQVGLLAYVAYPAFTCRVNGSRGGQTLIKLTGSQRPVGIIYPSDPLRSVFLGTLMLGNETRMMQYGGDPERDMAGYVERIGPGRWRLILPRPAFESMMDVIELVPIG